MTLILCGFPFSGKSFFGKLLADRRRVPFFDADSLLETLYASKTKEKLSCREIFIQKGEDAFRNLEQEVLGQIPKMESLILALGGGSLQKREIQEKVQEIGTVVYLQVSPEILFHRMMQTKQIPAYLDPQNVESSFARLWEKRSKIYEKCAHFTLSMEGKTEKEVLERLENFLV